MKSAIGILAVIALGGALAGARSPSPSVVPYPDGYRTWTHVKSTLVAPTHQNFPTMGGFQHIYANGPAMAGYRSRAFPEGSVVAFEWLELRDSAGAYREGPRRRLDVMMKDSIRFAATGGWGFQRFAGIGAERAASPTPEQCFACHQRLRRDALVLSHYRE